MRVRNSEEIEFLRKRIENLSIPINYNPINEKKKSHSKNKKKENKKKQNYIIDKKFNEIYELYNNDIEYKIDLREKERQKSLKQSHIASIQCDGLNQKKKFLEPKFNLNSFIKILEKNDHHSRHESKYEDDFSSSDSYDSDLFKFNQQAPKKFKFKNRSDIYNNKENLAEIMRVLSLSQNN